jgi:hypothetical protein
MIVRRSAISRETNEWRRSCGRICPSAARFAAGRKTGLRQLRQSVSRHGSQSGPGEHEVARGNGLTTARQEPGETSPVPVIVMETSADPVFVSYVTSTLARKCRNCPVLPGKVGTPERVTHDSATWPNALFPGPVSRTRSLSEVGRSGCPRVHDLRADVDPRSRFGRQLS